MNWEAIGVIAEVVAALAVVVTLAFLTIETRRNRIAIESGSLDTLAGGWNTLNALVIEDPETADIWAKGFSDPDSLTPTQRTRFFFIGQSYINHFMTVKKHYDAGTLPEEEWVMALSATARTFNSPGGKWICEKAAITPGMVDLIREYEGAQRSHEDGYFGTRQQRTPENAP